MILLLSMLVVLPNYALLKAVSTTPTIIQAEIYAVQIVGSTNINIK